MNINSDFSGMEGQVAAFFKKVFAASEGNAEGELIGNLVLNLLTKTPKTDIRTYLAWDESELVGGIVFSRLTYSDDPRSVFVLGPVAVATDRQGQGIGISILQHGLDDLRTAGVDVALTYGDPGYYAKVGFHPVSESDAAAPFKLQHPHGWLGQSLSDGPLAPLSGSATCVEAFDDPAFW